YISAHAVALTERFARNRLVTRNHRLGTADLDNHIAVFHALHDSVDDLTDTVLEFFKLVLALGVAYFLDNDLLGGLRGDTAEIDRRQRITHESTDFQRGIAFFGVIKTDLIHRIFH